MGTAEQHGAPPPVLAAPAVFPAGYWLRWAAEWERERFWVIPAVLLLLGTGLAVLTSLGPGAWGSWGGGFADEGWSSGFLENIAAATLTFLGVVFTLTLVALQLASSQLSPRVVRMFVRSGVTRVAFGTQLASFAYAVTALVITRDHGGPAASRAVTVAAALVAAGLVVFLCYVTSMMTLLQVVDVIAVVARETRAAVAANWLPPAGGRPVPAPARVRDPQVLTLPARTRHRAAGRVLGVDHARLAELARRHDCVIELTVRMGEFVPAGAPFALAHCRPGCDRDAVSAGAAAAAVSFGRGRTLYQDPAFGLRQLADIAAQALSPAVNQPTTAVLVIDSLEDILLQLAPHPRHSGCYAGRDGTVRLTVPAPDWDECLDLAFTEITVFGASSPQVSRRLLAAYAALEAGAAPGRRPGLAARREDLARLLGEAGAGRAALRPDPLGLG
jgi:uncharacterized membrane protein